MRKTVSVDRTLVRNGDAVIAAGLAESWSALVNDAVTAHVRALKLAVLAADAAELDAAAEAATVARVQAAGQPTSARWSSLRAR